MYPGYIDDLELVRIYDMTGDLASSRLRRLAMFFGQALLHRL